MEGGDSRYVRSLATPAPAPALQTRRALSALQIIQGLRGPLPQRLPQISSGQHRIVSMAPQARRWQVHGGATMPVASLPVNQVRASGMVVSTFMVTTVRRQQGPLYHNTVVLPTAAPVPVSASAPATVPVRAPALAPPPPTTQMLVVQNSMPASMAPSIGQSNIEHDSGRFMGATPANQGLLGLPDVVSPVAVHGNGNPLACFFCGGVFALRYLDIPGLLPPPGFSYPEPIGPPPLPIVQPPARDTSLTAEACSDPHHFVLTMQYMPKQTMADLVWSSMIERVYIPTLAGAHGGHHGGMAPSPASITGATAPTMKLMQMSAIEREQRVLPLTLSSSSASPVGITSATVPSMLDLMPTQAIVRDQLSPPPTTSSSSASGLLCEYVMPEHEDMVHLTMGQSSTMDLDLSL